MNEMNDHSNPSTPLIDKNVTCNSECGLDLKLGQGCDGHKCKYISEIQSGAMSKSVQKPEQTEDEKIREAFAQTIPEYKLGIPLETLFGIKEFNDGLQLFSKGYKSRQPEIEELQRKQSLLVTRIGEHLEHIEQLEQQNKLLKEVVDGAILMNEKIKKVLTDTEQDG